ncbi:MAG TPA: MmgE/PrpD family protein, partial [Xanthobacteraceae bacterium]
MTSLERLAAHLSTELRGELPPAVRQTLALHLIDTIGAWIATAATAEARALKTFRAEQHGLAGNARDPALDVMINCALVRLSEIDDIHLASMTTPGAIVIPAVLTIAASLPANAGTLAAAILAGYEAMTRLGAAIDGPRVLYRGMWPSYMAAPFGVAAAAARLFDLSAATTAHALALALALGAPGVGYHSAPTTSRWLAAGSAARNGLLAAQAARAGLTADLAILDGPFLAGVYGITADAAALTEGLGQG